MFGTFQNTIKRFG